MDMLDWATYRKFMTPSFGHPHRWLLLGLTIVFLAVVGGLYFSDLHRAYLFAAIVVFGIFRMLVGLRVRQKKKLRDE